MAKSLDWSINLNLKKEQLRKEELDLRRFKIDSWSRSGGQTKEQSLAKCCTIHKNSIMRLLQLIQKKHCLGIVYQR